MSIFCKPLIDLRILALAGAVLLLWVIAGSPAAAGPLPEEFLGKFRGSVTGSSGEVKGDFTMESQAGRDSFTIVWPPNQSAVFEASDQNGVFHTASRGKYLEGAPGLWARLADGRLLVYSLQIDSHGAYDIRTYIYAPSEDGLDMVVRHLRVGSEPLESTARLKHYDR